MSVEVTKVAEKSGVYRIVYKNIGYDLAKNVVIEISLPDGLTVAGKNKFAWNAGDVGMGEGGFIEIKVDTSSNTQFALSRLIKKAWAVEGDEEKTFETKVYLADPDLDETNNQVLTWVTIRKFGDDSNDSSSQEQVDRLPIVEIEANNNVNDFVFTGDTVVFEVKLKNTNNTEAYENVLYHQIIDQTGRVVFGTAIELGKINSNEKSIIRFGLLMPREFFEKSGQYKSVSIIIGKSNLGTKYNSNEAYSDFGVKLKGWAGRIKPGVKEAEAQVLGVISGTNNSKPVNGSDMWAYLLLMLSSGTWLKIGIRKQLMEMAQGLAKNINFKFVTLLVLMTLSFGVATFNVVKNNSGLSAKIDRLSNNISQIKMLTMR
jgi:hypothetical protein